MIRTAVPAVLSALALGGFAHAQVFDVSFARPTADRWMYPFNFSRGAESTAPAFGAILQPGFDDRDSQMLLGFTTGGANPLIPEALGVGSYRVLSARLTVVVSNDLESRYDPTSSGFTPH